MKKGNMLIVIIIALIIIIGFLYYSQFIDNNNNEIVIAVGQTNFVIPEGYYIGHDNPDGAKNITNGTNSIFLLEHKGKNITKYVDDYNEYFNQSAKIENFTIDSYTVYKLTPPNTSKTHHFYFIKNKNVYDIYTWDGNPNIDSEVVKLITSS